MFWFAYRICFVLWFNIRLFLFSLWFFFCERMESIWWENQNWESKFASHWILNIRHIVIDWLYEHILWYSHRFELIMLFMNRFLYFLHDRAHFNYYFDFDGSVYAIVEHYTAWNCSSHANLLYKNCHYVKKNIILKIWYVTVL